MNQLDVAAFLDTVKPALPLLRDFTVVRSPFWGAPGDAYWHPLAAIATSGHGRGLQTIVSASHPTLRAHTSVLRDVGTPNGSSIEDPDGLLNTSLDRTSDQDVESDLTDEAKVSEARRAGLREDTPLFLF